ncbi:MAG: hypothetical protein M4579_000043 [Chaenotheca gracillima]|nr:MAG: hypothetical protein M4579_000043 [Chaenotheca gracillima]
MDLAKSLIRSIARGFFETKHILIIDALMIHSAVRDDDLAHLLGMQTKELRKLCAKLEEHRLLAVYVPLPRHPFIAQQILILSSHNRQEAREGMQRLITKTYYYIDFRQTIDAIKYRLFHMTKEVKGMGQPTEEKKDYFCPRCKARWTQMEVLDNPGPLGFNCNRCQNPLERDEGNVGNNSGTEKSSKLASQLEPLLKLLQKIDESVIPDNTFETALSVAVPVMRNQNTNPIAPTIPVDQNGLIPTAVRGLAQTGPQHIKIDLTSDGEKSATEQAAEAKRKAAFAEQNALPVWHTQSTVTGPASAAASKEALAAKEREVSLTAASALDASTEEKKPIKGEMEMTDEMAKYYADLARENELKAQAKEDEESSGSGDEGYEEEDEDEFEDVPTTATASINGTANGNGTSIARVKSEPGSESESSGPSGTNAATPATVDEKQEPPMKKVRIEEPVKPGVKEETTEKPGPDTAGESEEDEEVEFEDV